MLRLWVFALLATSVVYTEALRVGHRGPDQGSGLLLDPIDRKLEQTATERRTQKAESPDPVPKRTTAEVYAAQQKAKQREIPKQNIFVPAKGVINTLSVAYLHNESAGIPTKRGDRVIFEVPENLRDLQISRVWLVHRKDASNSSLFDDSTYIKKKDGREWDMQPAYHSVKCHDASTGVWREWFGPRYSTEEGDPRGFDDPKRDNRFFAPKRSMDSPFYEHVDDVSVRLNGAGNGRCDLIMVKNVAPPVYVCTDAVKDKSKKESQQRRGKDCWAPSPHGWGRVHGVRIEFAPAVSSLNRRRETQVIFTPSTVFANPPHDAVPHFGGGREIGEKQYAYNKNRLYPGAQLIGTISKEMLKTNASLLKKYPYKPVTWLNFKYGPPSKETDTEDAAGKAYMIIRLSKQFSVAQCEVAMGNTKVDPSKTVAENLNRDRFVGTEGKSTVIVNLRTFEEPNKTQIMFPGGFPVNGNDKRAFVLTLAPNTPPELNPKCPWEYGCNYFRVDVIGDPIYVMGVRCQYYRKVQIAATPMPTPWEARPNSGSAVGNTTTTTTSAKK